MAGDTYASYWSAIARAGRDLSGTSYYVNRSASYWSATADVGKTPDSRRPSGETASYWSATANVGDGARVSLSETVTDATYYNRRNIPPVINRGEAGSAYRTQQTIADMEKARRRPSALMKKLSKGDDRALDNQDAFFLRLRERLSTLGKKVSVLKDPASFNPNMAKSSNPEAVAAEPSIFAQEKTYSITVERLAVAHQVASDQQDDTHETLGLSGSFSINGYTVTVESSDSVADLRDKINYGEDSNKDGELNIQSEDINQNGRLDSFHHGSVYIGGGRYLPSFHYYEDIDKDGEVDQAEDTNGDESLNGGSGSILAEARLEDDRLVIKNLDGADKSLRIEDPDDILETLGFFKTDDLGEKQLVTSIDSDYNLDPKTALFTVNGESKEYIDNIVESVIPEVLLSLKKTTSREVEVTVYKDPDSAVENIVSFATSYNDAIGLVNKENLDHMPARDNIRVQDLAVDLARAASSEVSSIPAPPRALTDLGLPPSNALPRGVNIATLEAIKEGIGENGLRVKPTPRDPGVANRLDRLGITSADDFTLTVDTKKLSTEIKKKPEAAYEVFNRKGDGVIDRIEKKLDLALNGDHGIIEFQRRLVDYYQSQPGAVSEQMERSVQGLSEEINKERFTSIFGTITA